MNSTVVLQNYGELGQGEHNEVAQLLAKVIALIIRNFFLSLAPTFVLTLSCRSSIYFHFYVDVLERLFPIGVKMPLQIVVIPADKPTNIPGRRFLNLILVDSYQSFREIDIISYTADYDNNEFYHIVLQVDNHEVLLVEMQKIFQYCWSNHIINCNIQAQNGKGQVRIYSYFPYTALHCGKVAPVVINEFDGANLSLNVLFPKKLRNFHGCPLRAALWNVPPFVYLETYQNGTYHIVNGFEGYLLKELAKKLNFIVDIIVPPNNERQGDFWPPVVNGALGMLRNRTVDLSLGCFRQSAARNRLATSTFNYYRSAMVISFLTAPYKLSSQQILVYPFRNETWLLIHAIIGVVIIVHAIYNKYSTQYPQLLSNYRVRHSGLSTMLMAVGMSASISPVRHHQRVFYSSMCLYTLLIRTVYQSLLFHLIRTQQTTRLPQSLDELRTNNFTVVGNRPTYYTLRDILQHVRWLGFNSTRETIQYEYLEHVARKGIVAAGPLDFLIHYGVTYKKADVFNILRQYIIAFPTVMYLTKHSFLIDQFDEELLRLRVVGLTDFWYRREIDCKYFSTNMAKGKVFGMDELHMIFVNYAWGLCCALILFVLEVLSRHSQPLRNFLGRF